MSSSVLYRTYPKLKWGENRWKKNGRHPLDPERIYLPFKETMPLKLRNSVLGAGKNIKEAPCIPQMMKLFECLQRNEHHQSNCEEEVGVFQQCFEGYRSHLEAKKKGLISAEPVPHSRRLSTEQLNTLLFRHPQRNK